jgi:ATP-binding cassette subfamily F protein 3
MRDEAIERPRIHDTITLRLKSADRTGDFVLRTDNLSVGYDGANPLLFAGRLEVERGRRIGIVGPNGTGKTTLLRTLLGEIPALEGEVKMGANVRIGYLSQTHAQLDPDWTALYAVQLAGKGVTEENGRSLLGSLLLSGDDVFKTVAQLSGGQRSRVVLARLVVQGPNVLILDEPTNHLDIPSMEIIEDVLRGYDGTILFVSHDRHLVQEVATDVWAIDGGEIRLVRGGWEGYVAWREQRASGAGTLEKTAARAAKEERKAIYFENRKQGSEAKRLKRQHEKIEKDIGTTEKELEKLDHAITFAGEAGDVAKVSELGIQYQRAYERLKKLWEDWETVGEQLEAAE